MDKRMMLKLNGGRAVTGILRGFDPFMNVVLDDTVEECKDNTKNSIGMVVRTLLGLLEAFNKIKQFNFQVIRGNSIVMVEALDRVWYPISSAILSTLDNMQTLIKKYPSDNKLNVNYLTHRLVLRF